MYEKQSIPLPSSCPTDSFWNLLSYVFCFNFSNVVFISAAQQRESAIIIRIYIYPLLVEPGSPPYKVALRTLKELFGSQQGASTDDQSILNTSWHCNWLGPHGTFGCGGQGFPYIPCFSSSLKYLCCLLAKSCLTIETPWTVARQAPLSREFDNSIWCTFPVCFADVNNFPFSNQWKMLTTWWP